MFLTRYEMNLGIVMHLMLTETNEIKHLGFAFHQFAQFSSTNSKYTQQSEKSYLLVEEAVPLKKCMVQLTLILINIKN